MTHNALGKKNLAISNRGRVSFFSEWLTVLDMAANIAKKPFGKKASSSIAARRN